MKPIENTAKKIQDQSNKNNFIDFNLYNKKVDALITKFKKASISSNITNQLNTGSEKANKLDNLVKALTERVKKVEDSNTNITNNLNASLCGFFEHD